MVGACCVGAGKEESMDKTVESVGWRPLCCHMIDVVFTIGGLGFSVFLEEPLEDITKNGIGVHDAYVLICQPCQWCKEGEW